MRAPDLRKRRLWRVDPDLLDSRVVDQRLQHPQARDVGHQARDLHVGLVDRAHRTGQARPLVVGHDVLRRLTHRSRISARVDTALPHQLADTRRQGRRRIHPRSLSSEGRAAETGPTPTNPATTRGGGCGQRGQVQVSRPRFRGSSPRAPHTSTTGDAGEAPPLEVRGTSLERGASAHDLTEVSRLTPQAAFAPQPAGRVRRRRPRRGSRRPRGCTRRTGCRRRAR